MDASRRKRGHRFEAATYTNVTTHTNPTALAEGASA